MTRHVMITAKVPNILLASACRRTTVTFLLCTQTWHASYKELKSFLNHVSTKAQYSQVVFLEADYEKQSMRVR